MIFRFPQPLLSSVEAGSAGTGGPKFATDQNGEIHWPYTKVAWGATAAFNEVSDTLGKRLPVVDSILSATVATVAGTPPASIAYAGALSTPSPAAGWGDGQICPVQVSTSGSLWVQQEPGAGVYAYAGVTAAPADVGTLGVGVRTDIYTDLSAALKYAPFQIGKFGGLVVEGGIIKGTDLSAAEDLITGIPILWEDAGEVMTTVTATNGLPVNIVDGSSSGTQYAEDANISSTPTGTLAVWRNAGTAEPVSTEAPMPVSVIGGGGGGTSMVDDAAFNDATDSFTPVGGYFDDTTPGSVTDGFGGVARITALRALHVNLRDNTGAEITSFGGGTQYAENSALGTNPTGNAILWRAADNTAVVPSATEGLPVEIVAGSTGATEYVFDVPSAATPQGPTWMTERRDVPISLGVLPADADWGHLYQSAKGALWVAEAGIPADGNNAYVAASPDIFMRPLSALCDDSPIAVVGNDEVGPIRMTPEHSMHVELRSATAEIGITGNPLFVHNRAWTAGSLSPLEVEGGTVAQGTDVFTKVGAERTDNLSSVVSTTDKYLSLKVNPGGSLRVNSAGYLATSATVGTSEATGTPVYGNATLTTDSASALLAAGEAGRRYAITSIIATNSHPTVDTRVQLRDGTTVILEGFCKADGGGFTHSGGCFPIFVGTDQTAVNALAFTTGSNVYVSVSGYYI